MSNCCAVRNSLLENAGLGLFATRNIRKGEIVTEYGGEVVDQARATILLNNGQDTHLRSVCPMFQALDGRIREQVFTQQYYEQHNMLGSFANSSPDSKLNNVKYVTIRKGYGRVHPYGGVAVNRIVLKAIKPIQEGEEIYVNYGKSYNRRHLAQ